MSLCIYQRIRCKATDNLPLAPDERTKLEEMMIESYTERISRISDEMLCEEAFDSGVIVD